MVFSHFSQFETLLKEPNTLRVWTDALDSVINTLTTCMHFVYQVYVISTFVSFDLTTQLE